MRALALLSILVPATLGCASSPALQAAQSHDLPALAKAITEANKRGAIDDAEAKDIARAVAEHEVTHGDDKKAEDAVVAFGRCVRPLAEAFELRAQGTNDLAAAAALARVDGGVADADEARSLAGRSALSAAWRAVEARSLVFTEDGDKRRERMRDGDQEVRVAALRAAAEAIDAQDLESLLEAARLDPHPLARSLAIRAVSSGPGTERAVIALRDLWSGADEIVRQAIADAWGAPRLVDVGGRRELIWAAETQRGMPALAAAGALAQLTGEGVSEAIGVLVRTIEDGPPNERIFALGLAPLSDPFALKAVDKAAEDKDDVIAVTAAWRKLTASGQLAPSDKDRKALVKRLFEIAKSDSTRALQAQKALAAAGEKDVVPLAEKGLSSKDPVTREASGHVFVMLGQTPKAVVLVADNELSVRASVACAVLQKKVQ